jgi:chromosome condensin MukBEF ATPase and DNA-binding subunit MukB
MAQPQQTDHRTRTIDKAGRLVTDLETLETRLSTAIADAESIREALELTEEPTWPDYDPAVYRQLRETVRLLQQRTQDPSIRLDLERIARVLSAVTDS